MKLWCKPYYQAARVFRCFLFYIFLFIPSIASIKVCNPMRACERSRSPLAYGQTKCVCMTLVFLLHSTAIRVYAQARYALRLHMFTDLLYNGFQITQATELWASSASICSLKNCLLASASSSMSETLGWWNIFPSPLSPFPEVREEKELLASCVGEVPPFLMGGSSLLGMRLWKS